MSDTPIADVTDTALWVAHFRAAESARADALFKDPLAAMLAGERGRTIAREMPYPGILAWTMAVRTVAIDRLVFAALAEGVDMVVNIGAGLDARPYRLELPASLQWVEVDFPNLIDAKSATLAHATPHCRLERIGINVANREIAARTYREIGERARKALVITEGVIPYLANDEAAGLAQDLRAVPSLRYWIQDYHGASHARWRPKNLQQKLRNAPFRFEQPDPLAFFAQFGWRARIDVNALQEGNRLGRPFPMPFPWNYIVALFPKARVQAARRAIGYALLEAV